MKGILLFLSLFTITSVGFCADRFQTETERTNELLTEINENIDVLCNEMKTLTFILKQIGEIANIYREESVLQN